MCGVPDPCDCETCEDVQGRGSAQTKKLLVSDGAIAEMLARVAAGCSSASSASDPESVAEFSKRVVESLLQFRS